MFATILHGALKVTVEVSVTAAADNILRFKKKLSWENKAWYFMWTVS